MSQQSHANDSTAERKNTAPKTGVATANYHKLTSSDYQVSGAALKLRALGPGNTPRFSKVAGSVAVPRKHLQGAQEAPDKLFKPKLVKKAIRTPWMR